MTNTPGTRGGEESAASDLPSSPARPGPGEAAARQRTIHWRDPEATRAAALALSGLEMLRAMQAGALPPPPMLALCKVLLVEVGPGRAVFECAPDESMYNPLGTVHGGLVCTLADTAGACAVHSTLPAGVGYTSVDISVNYLRPVTVDSGPLRAVGRVVKPGRRIAVGGVEITDAAGKLVATASTTCLVFA